MIKRRTSRAIVIKDDRLLVMYRNKFGREYISLCGGEIEPGETEVEALSREIMEEAGIAIAHPRLVIVEDAGDIFGIQYIYLCDYVSGQPQLDPASPESKISAMGKNLYRPGWLPIDELAESNMLPTELKDLLVQFFKDGFPDSQVSLKIES